jgi:hypothetical protein
VVAPLSDALSERADATLYPLAKVLLGAFQSFAAASLVGSPSWLSVAIVSVVSALGTDEGDLSSSQSSLATAVAADLGIDGSSLSASIRVAHPPRPPPGSPPLPSLPPFPPRVPPGTPSAPPSGGWATPYTEGCDPTTCPDGCFSSLWSEMYTWVGQGLALGGPSDDALYVWPRFKSNVTIKQCRTVVLDLNVDLQLYSIVVRGTLIIQDRGPDTSISLRTICIHVEEGGRLLAGEPQHPFSGVLSLLFVGDELSSSAQCGTWHGRTLM